MTIQLVNNKITTKRKTQRKENDSALSFVWNSVCLSFFFFFNFEKNKIFEYFPFFLFFSSIKEKKNRPTVEVLRRDEEIESSKTPSIDRNHDNTELWWSFYRISRRFRWSSFVNVVNISIFFFSLCWLNKHDDDLHHAQNIKTIKRQHILDQSKRFVSTKLLQLFIFQCLKKTEKSPRWSTRFFFSQVNRK